MSLEIIITVVDGFDYDNNPTQFKSVIAKIGGKALPIAYSYDVATENSVIEQAVENDVANRGYEW